MASGRLIDYLGYGTAASRPAAPDLYAGTLGLWLSTDTLAVDVWNGTQWFNVGNAGSPVTSVNGQVGAVLIGINDLIDVLLPTGGVEPDDQALLVYDSVVNAWVQLEPGVPGDVLTVTTAGLRYEPAGAGAVTSVNGQTGAVSLSLEDLDDVLVNTGSPAVGDVLTWNGLRWEADPAGTGDVSGPASSTDNTVPRFVGTTGKTIEDTGVIIGDNDELYGYRAEVGDATGSSYTFVIGDTGLIKEISHPTNVHVTLDAQMPAKFAVTVVQMGAGTLDFIPETGATLLNRQSHSASAGQYAVCVLYVSENSGGNAAVWVLGGDTAA